MTTTSPDRTITSPVCNALPSDGSLCLRDSFGRNIDYLRISLTDRCNLRCVYCIPEEGVPSLRREEILTLEEIETISALAAEQGIKHIRLTGGEPLIRKGIVDLIHSLKAIPGIESVALTTNGILLGTMAQELKEAGLDRVNISLDSLDPKQYHAITRRGHLSDALKGIDAALTHGLDPVKINVVAIRRFKQDFTTFANLTIDQPLHVRFIEYMPVGHVHDDSSASSSLSNNMTGFSWAADDVISAQEIFMTLTQELTAQNKGALIPLPPSTSTLNSDDAESCGPEGWGPATYYQIKGAQGTIGFISAVSEHFCSSCNRLRLTSDGRLRSCLFSDAEVSLRDALRNHGSEGVYQAFERTLKTKPAGHHNRLGTARSMNQMGG